MEFIRRMLGMVQIKPYKIQDCYGKKRVGVTASDLKDLKAKAKSKLSLVNIESIYLEDGTEVEDDAYFSTVLPQTVLIILQEGEVWEGCKFLIQSLYLLSTSFIINLFTFIRM